MKSLLTFCVFLFPFFGFSQSKPSAKDRCAPILLLDGYKSGDTISKKDLPGLKMLTVFYPCTKEFSYRIIGYMFTIGKGSSQESFHGYTHLLSSKILNSLTKADAGTIIFIDLVVIRKKDLSTHHIPGMALRVSLGKSSVPVMIEDDGSKALTCDPIFYLGQFKGGASITLNQLNLIKQASLGNTCNIGKKVNGCWADIPYKTFSYKVSTKIADQVWNAQSPNNEFPVEVREQFRTMKDSAQLLISDIKAKYDDGSIVEIPPVSFTIVRGSKPPKEGVNNTTRTFRKK